MSQPKEIIKIGQLEVHILLDGNDTNGEMVMFEFIIPSGAKVPIPHYHKDVDEVLYGLEGVTTSIVDGKKIDIAPGDRLFIPRGVIHYHDNHTPNLAKTLCILTPASIGPIYFREISELIKPGLPPDPAKAAEIMLRHGLVPANK
ncbi:MAG: cupin domain-containing protein [Sphingobacteriia bacterium]|nr:cupin domain-containing protein [Sphingobacteriia bacterium]